VGDLRRVEDAAAAPGLEVASGARVPDELLAERDPRGAHVRRRVQRGPAAGRRTPPRRALRERVPRQVPPPGPRHDRLHRAVRARLRAPPPPVSGPRPSNPRV
jgi:hypothetical protein